MAKTFNATTQRGKDAKLGHRTLGMTQATHTPNSDTLSAHRMVCFLSAFAVLSPNIVTAGEDFSGRIAASATLNLQKGEGQGNGCQVNEDRAETIPLSDSPDLHSPDLGSCGQMGWQRGPAGVATLAAPSPGVEVPVF
jgi:hypothetical protein